MSTVTTPAEAADDHQADAERGQYDRRHGTGSSRPSWHMAVKTGTAQVQAPSGPEQTDDWMIGFLPAASGTPQLAIAVVVPYQAFSLTGAQIAGPIVQQVFAGLPRRDRRTGMTAVAKGGVLPARTGAQRRLRAPWNRSIRRGSFRTATN